MKGNNGLALGVGVHLPGVIRAVFKRLAYIIMFGVITLIWTYIGINRFMPSKYTASASIVIIVNQDISRNFSETQMNQTVQQFWVILNSELFHEILWADLKTVDKSEGTFTATVQESSNVIEMEARGNSPKAAYMIINEAVAHYQIISGYTASGYTTETLAPPQLDRISVTSNRAYILAVFAGMLAFMVGAGFVGLVHIFSGKADNSEQVKAKVQADYLGQIYYERKKGGKKSKDGLVITKPTVSFGFTSDIKKITNSVERGMEPGGKRSLLVSSTMANEGKSTVAANIALMLAKKGKKVLLLDLNLRKPSLAKLLEIKVPENKEITTVLKNDAVHTYKPDYDPRYKIYYLLGTRMVKEEEFMQILNNLVKMLEEARPEMDYIIIDSAPFYANQDTQIIGGYTDALLLVTRQGEASIDMLNDMIEESEDADISILGVVLNGVKTKVAGSKRKEYRNGL